MINKNLDQTGVFVFSTSQHFNFFGFHPKEKSFYLPCILPGKPENELYLKDFLYNRPEMEKILSLPDKLYKQIKDSLVVSLKKNHKKLILGYELFNAVAPPSTRMKDFEKAFFGRVLVPGERPFYYKVNIKKTQSLAVQQSAMVYVHGRAADKRFYRLLVMSQTALLLIDVFIRSAAENKVLLEKDTSIVKLLNNNKVVLGDEFGKLQNMHDFLLSFKDKKKYNPSISDVRDDLNKKYPEGIASVCTALRYDQAKDCTSDLKKPSEADKYNVIYFVDHITWLKKHQESVDYDEQGRKSSMEQRLGGIQEAYNNIKKIIDALGGTSKSLSQFS